MISNLLVLCLYFYFSAPRVESSHSSTPFAADSAGSTTPNLQTLQQNLLNDNSDTVLDPKNILTLTAPEGLFGLYFFIFYRIQYCNSIATWNLFKLFR